MNDSTYQHQQQQQQQPDSTTFSYTDSRKKQGDSDKKRSCDTCRNRKVSCDAYLRYPCTKCCKAGIECLISEPKKYRPPSRKYVASLEKRIEHLETLLSKQNITIDYDDDEMPTATTNDGQSSIIALDDTRKDHQNIISLSPSCEPKHGINYLSNSNDIRKQQKRPSKFVFSPWMNIMENSNGEQQQEYGSISIDNKPLTSSSSSPQQVPTQATMDLIKEIPSFTLDLAERMIKSYFQYVHTRLPTIDKRLFLIQYYYQYPQPVERHLFFAICAVGSRFLPRTDLSTDNYSVERQVAKHLRAKAMDIMQLAYKRSTLYTLQTLLLVALLAPNSDNGEGTSTNWLILGAAIRMSQDLELHREDRYQHLPKGEIELRRRLAHAVYIGDKLSAAATGKPFTIRDEDFNVQIPSIYEQEPDDESISINEVSSNNGYVVPTLLKQTEKDILEQRPIYTPHIQVITMAQWIGHILVSLYIHRNDGNDYSTDDILADPNMIANIDVGLNAWKEATLSSLSKEYDYQLDTITWNLYRETSNLLYNAGTLLLYRPLLFNHGTTIALMGTTSNQLLSVCTTAARSIVDIFERVPVWGAPFMKDFVISLCATIFLQGYNSEDMTISFHARKNIQRCANIYKNDELICQCQNAVVLDELSKQLPDRQESQDVQPVPPPSLLQQEEQQHNNNERSVSLFASFSDDANNNISKDDKLGDTIMTTAFPESNLNDGLFMDILLSWQELQQKHHASARHEVESAVDTDLDQLMMFK